MNTSFPDDKPVELPPDDEPLTETGILIVDEDPAFQLGLKTFLKEYVGFDKVFTARSGKEAIEVLEKEVTIELLTLDYQMPEMDGLELLRYLRENAPRPLGVTMITGFPSEELKKNYANCGTDTLLTGHFLAKPVEFEKLEPIILDCYEELKRAERLAETFAEQTEVEEIIEQEPDLFMVMEANEKLLARVQQIERKLDANHEAVEQLAQTGGCGAFFLDVLKLVVAAGILFLGWSLLENGKPTMPFRQGDGQDRVEETETSEVADPPSGETAPAGDEEEEVVGKEPVSSRDTRPGLGESADQGDDSGDGESSENEPDSGQPL